MRSMVENEERLVLLLHEGPMLLNLIEQDKRGLIDREVMQVLQGSDFYFFF